MYGELIMVKTTARALVGIFGLFFIISGYLCKTTEFINLGIICLVSVGFVSLMEFIENM